MSCEVYNIIKEGHLTNLTTAPVDKLTYAQILALYDGDATTPAVTISGAASVGLLAEYGEAYDVCYVDYHTNEAVASNISIKYGTTSGTENVANISLHTAGVYRATVSGIASFVELRHELTATSTDINQLNIVAVRLETLGFGDNISEPDEQLMLEHATIGSPSASVNVIPLFNNNATDEVVKIAITPTLTREDQYLYLATDIDGPYYGIDEHGYQQPGPDPIPLVDDSMLSADSIHPQWVRRMGYNKNTIYPTAEGIMIEAGEYNHAGIANYTARGLLTKEYFTAHSFTAEIQVRFVGFTGGYFAGRTDSFCFALTNGALIGDILFYQGYTTEGRVGMSTAGVGVTKGSYDGDSNTFTTDSMVNTFAFVDGTLTNNLRYTPADISWSNKFIGGGLGGFHNAYEGRTDAWNASGFEKIANVGKSMYDFTPSSEWHTWRLSYDHQKQELSGFIDKFYMGKCVIKADKFHSGCKFFIGSLGIGGLNTQIRNFKLYPNKVYQIKNVALPSNGGVFSATVSGEAANVNKLNDSNSSTYYVAPFPDGDTRVRVDFDKEYDIVNYDIFQRKQGENGSAIPTYNGIKYYVETATSAIVDYGGKALYGNIYRGASDDYFETRYTEKRSPTWSGGAVTISGINYVEWNFTEYETGWPGPQTNVALTIGKIDVWAEYWYDVLDVPGEPDPEKIPWFKGRWYNIRQAGADGALHIRDPSLLNVSWYPGPQYLLPDVDFGFSSAAYNAGSARNHDYTELLFSSTGNAHSGGYTEWYSENQQNEEPFYLWRYFPVETDVTLIYIACGNHPSYHGPKDFKLQYLNEGGNPNVDADWKDIPPITRQHHKTTRTVDLRYGGYKQYKIDNNDGEWYTDAHLQFTSAGQPGGYGQIQFGVFTNDVNYNCLEDLVSLRHRRNDGVRMESNNQTSPLNLGNHILVEPDVPIRTRGIRFVAKNPAWSYSHGGDRDDISVYEFQVFGKEGAGAYTSPVFDTGTPQNTERLSADLHTPAGTRAAVYVRSAPVPPEIAYNINFEVWEPLGALGEKDGLTPSTPTNYHRCISVGDETHFLLGSPYTYNHVTDRWSQKYGGYPAQAPGDPVASDTFDSADLGSGLKAAIKPDDRVDDCAALVGNVIYMAAKETANTGFLRIMFLDLDEPEPFWDTLRTQRPIETTEACMVAYDRKLYFFNEDGTIFYWDIDAYKWVLLSVTVPVNGSDRDRAASAEYNGKIYIFGVNEDSTRAHRVDIFDPVREEFTPGADAPRGMLISEAIVVGNIIYLLPKSTGAFMRYYPDEDRWEVVVSLHHSSEYGGGTVYTFFVHDDYLYRVGTGYTGLARALIKKPVWEHGEVPSPIDPVWGGKSAFTNLPWQRIGGLGELMPQNRYFQYKVELYCDSWVNPGNGVYPDLSQPAVENSPSLKSVKIVTPQEMTIPASGTANAYLKIQASEEGDFRVWYTAEGRLIYGTNGGHNYETSWPEDLVTMYTSSTTPYSWPVATTASGFNGQSLFLNVSDRNGKGTKSPWVLPDGAGGYDMWYCGTLPTGNRGQYRYKPPSIYYINTKDPSEMSANNAVELEVVPAGTLAATAGAIWHPTVVLTSGTNYKMWFTAVDLETYSASGPIYTTGDERAIGFCESTDKVNWTPHRL